MSLIHVLLQKYKTKGCLEYHVKPVWTSFDIDLLESERIRLQALFDEKARDGNYKGSRDVIFYIESCPQLDEELIGETFTDNQDNIKLDYKDINGKNIESNILYNDMVEKVRGISIVYQNGDWYAIPDYCETGVLLSEAANRLEPMGNQ